MVDVKIIHRDGHAALVEHIVKGEPFRVVVPSVAVEGKQTGKVAKSELDAGHSYGDDFTQIDGVGPELAFELKRIGVWVKADLIACKPQVRNAIQQAYVVPLFNALLEFAKEK
jgi:predicted flap endonuclease-1-like 5' DNA nuclease